MLKIKKRFAFLYLDKTYSIYHSIGIAVELSILKNTEVVVFCNKRSYPLVKNFLSEKYNKVKIRYLRPYWYFQVPVYVEIKIQMRNIFFRKYRSELSKFDVIISGIYDDLSLKRILFNDVKIVFYDHGPANREYSFKNSIKEYDYVLLHSKWELKKRKENKQVTDINSSVIGYPKLDVIPRNDNKKLFNNNNKVVLYNPHWQRQFSSYFKHGKVILNFFKNHPEINLIFAPHSLLKERYPKIFLDLIKYRKKTNIILDLGSEKANNMTYIESADIYLGDISSQALEFCLLKRGPCIFSNSQNISDIDVPISWGMGKVYDNISSKTLDSVLNDAEPLFVEKYRKEQDKIINQIFTISDSISSSLSAAKAIYNYAKTL